jgi:hypothetical protein
MKNLINQNAAELDMYIACSISELSELGWDLNDITFQEIEKRENDPENEASTDFTIVEKELDEKLIVILFLTGTPEEPVVSYVVEKNSDWFGGISNGCSEESGDNEKSVEDIHSILKKRNFKTSQTQQNRGLYDASVDAKDHYTPAFIL